jgi:hypothetical protein
MRLFTNECDGCSTRCQSCSSEILRHASRTRQISEAIAQLETLAGTESLFVWPGDAPRWRCPLATPYRLLKYDVIVERSLAFVDDGVGDALIGLQHALAAERLLPPPANKRDQSHESDA